jgi:hypothetical protein
LFAQRGGDVPQQVLMCCEFVRFELRADGLAERQSAGQHLGRHCPPLATRRQSTGQLQALGDAPAIAQGLE